MDNQGLQRRKIQRRKKSKGASLVEYALLVALIAIIAIAAVRALGQKVSTKYSQSSSAL